MMLRKIVFIFLISLVTSAKAQLLESFEHSGEMGLSIGLGHYFGDLNPDVNIKKPKFSAGAFFQKQFNNYVGMRISGNYAFRA